MNTNRYLNNADYYHLIQPVQLNQLLQIGPTVSISNNYKLLRAELTAQEEVSSYLRQRYDIISEFTATNVWIYNATYSAGARVIIDFTNTFTSSVAYATGSTLIYNGEGYMSMGIGATTSTPDMLPNYWLDLGQQYSIYSAVNPYPQFNCENFYNVGDQVYWHGAIYTCTQQTLLLTTGQAIQYERIEWLPPANVFPDDVKSNNNGQYWQKESNYQISLNTPLNATMSIVNGTSSSVINVWAYGDNRSFQIVNMVIECAIFNLHKTIAPMNIPTMRSDSYKEVKKLLELVAMGKLNLNMPVLQPTQGSNIRFMGSIRNNNVW